MRDHKETAFVCNYFRICLNLEVLVRDQCTDGARLEIAVDDKFTWDGDGEAPECVKSAERTYRAVAQHIHDLSVYSDDVFQRR